ncbi:putative GRX5-glutaredoxin [Violaceomyces palustris]|uniref:GRX5-glutaredoxin n=1 Tax=Violaceomyces palustris TaxID=1673888 RepID=A0ACD0NL16_9BASI|nr:putative GRX5-glutaredoxin [Violaceomyces palustris]
MSFLRTATGALRLSRSALPPLASGSTPANLLIASRRYLSSEARKKIDEAVQNNPLVIFMKGTPEMPMCGFSRAVCQIMEVQGVKAEFLKTFNCLEDQELREGIKEYSSWPTIPQVYVKGEFVGGCDIMLSMHQSGELEKMLDEAGVLHPIQASPETVQENKA